MIFRQAQVGVQARQVTQRGGEEVNLPGGTVLAALGEWVISTERGRIFAVVPPALFDALYFVETPPDPEVGTPALFLDTLPPENEPEARTLRSYVRKLEGEVDYLTISRLRQEL